MPGNLRWRYEALYPTLSPSVEYVADETRGDTPFDTYSAGNPHLYLLPMAFVRGRRCLSSHKRCVLSISLWRVLLTINGLLLVMLDVYNMKDKQKNRPLKASCRYCKCAVFYRRYHSGFSADRQVSYDLVCRSGRICGCTDAGIWDSILGFVAGVQLSANDMLRMGTGWRCRVALPMGCRRLR